MPLLDLWTNSKDAVLGMNIQQIVSVAGEGKLLDQSDSSNELREYLSQVDREYLEAYFNDFLASQLGGQAEVVIKYDFEGPSGKNFTVRLGLISLQRTKLSKVV